MLHHLHLNAHALLITSMFYFALKPIIKIVIITVKMP